MSEAALMTPDEVQAYVEQARKRQKNLSGKPIEYKCKRCNDTGWWHLGYNPNHYSFVDYCSCAASARVQRQMQNSGLIDLLRECTFDSFMTDKPFRKEIARSAAEYANSILNGGNEWFFIGGQPGSGKTHICAAICGKLLDEGIRVQYMQWVEAARKLKGCAYDDGAFQELMAPYQNAPVLYIDDLFKESMTDADRRLAFEILNERYIRKRVTIISTEKTLTEALSLDEGLFGRVKTMAGKYALSISADAGKDFRLTEERRAEV